MIRALLILALLLVATPAFGQACQPYQKLEALLFEKYDERPIAAGLEVSGKLIRVYASTGEDPTWTLVLITPQGVACVMAVGVGWQHDLAPPKDDST